MLRPLIGITGLADVDDQSPKVLYKRPLGVNQQVVEDELVVVIEDNGDGFQAMVGRPLLAALPQLGDEEISFVVADDDDLPTPVVGKTLLAVAPPVFDEEELTFVVEEADDVQATVVGKPLLAMVPLQDDEEALSFVLEDDEGPMIAVGLSRTVIVPPISSDEEATTVVLEEDDVAPMAVGKPFLSLVPLPVDEELVPILIEDEESGTKLLVGPSRHLRVVQPQPAEDEIPRPTPPPVQEIAPAKRKRTGGGDWPESNLYDALERDDHHPYWDHNVEEHNAELIAEERLEATMAQVRALVRELADKATVEVNALETSVVVDSSKTDIQLAADPGAEIGRLETSIESSSAGVDVRVEVFDVTVDDGSGEE